MIFDLIFVEYRRKVEMACCELFLLSWVWLGWKSVNNTPGFDYCWARLAEHQYCLSTFPYQGAGGGQDPGREDKQLSSSKLLCGTLEFVSCAAYLYFAEFGNVLTPTMALCFALTLTAWLCVGSYPL